MQSKILVSVLVVVGILLLTGIGALTFSKFTGGPINTDRYQAVFLTNGQVYFGRLSNLNSDYARLTDIYYLQVTQTDAESALQDENNTQGQNISLAKLGNELHAPEDEMFIASDQILFWENLKDSGQVTEAIQDYVNNGGADAAAGSGSDLNSGTQPAGTPQQNDTPGDSQTPELDEQEGQAPEDN